MTEAKQDDGNPAEGEAKAYDPTNREDVEALLIHYDLSDEDLDGLTDRVIARMAWRMGFAERGVDAD